MANSEKGKRIDPPRVLLLDGVKWLGESLKGVSLAHVFIEPADNGSEGDSVSRKTHFPGVAKVLRESVHDEPPLLPHVRREELRNEVTVKSITFIVPREEVQQSWPSTARLVPQKHKLVVVTLEEGDRRSGRISVHRKRKEPGSPLGVSTTVASKVLPGALSCG